MEEEDPSKRRLTSERYKDFTEAVEILYIHGNLSGRLLFLKEWPAAGVWIFGEELIRFDSEGTKDRERRVVLEAEAEARRMKLFKIAESFETNSAVDGTLQLDYVQNIVLELQREIALCLYANHIVDRFIPPPPEPEKEETEEAAESEQAATEENAVQPEEETRQTWDEQNVVYDYPTQVAPTHVAAPTLPATTPAPEEEPAMPAAPMDIMDSVKPISTDPPPPPTPEKPKTPLPLPQIEEDEEEMQPLFVANTVARSPDTPKPDASPTPAEEKKD